MALRDVSAKVGKDGTPIAVKLEIPEGTKAKVALWGEKVVDAHAESSVIVAFQGGMRSQMKAGKSKADIQKWADSWKPGVRTPGKSMVDKLKEKMPTMSDEEKAELIAALSKKS